MGVHSTTPWRRLPAFSWPDSVCRGGGEPWGPGRCPANLASPARRWQQRASSVRAAAAAAAGASSQAPQSHQAPSPSNSSLRAPLASALHVPALALPAAVAWFVARQTAWLGRGCTMADLGVGFIPMGLSMALEVRLCC